MPDKPPKSNQSHDWSQFLVQNTPGAVVTADHRGRITEFNPAAERLSGFSREEAMGRQAEEILQLQGADLDIWNQVLRGGKRSPRNSLCTTVQARTCR